MDTPIPNNWIEMICIVVISSSMTTQLSSSEESKTTAFLTATVPTLLLYILKLSALVIVPEATFFLRAANVGFDSAKSVASTVVCMALAGPARFTVFVRVLPKSKLSSSSSSNILAFIFSFSSKTGCFFFTGRLGPPIKAARFFLKSSSPPPSFGFSSFIYAGSEFSFFVCKLD